MTKQGTRVAVAVGFFFPFLFLVLFVDIICGFGGEPFWGVFGSSRGGKEEYCGNADKSEIVIDQSGNRALFGEIWSNLTGLAPREE